MTKECPNCRNVIRNVAMRCDSCGYVFGKPLVPRPKGERIKHNACHGTGWLDYPTCLKMCRTCNGSGNVRV